MSDETNIEELTEATLAPVLARLEEQSDTPTIDSNKILAEAQKKR